MIGLINQPISKERKVEDDLVTIYEYQPWFDNVQTWIVLGFERMNDDIKNLFRFHLYLHDEIVVIKYLLR